MKEGHILEGEWQAGGWLRGNSRIFFNISPLDSMQRDHSSGKWHYVREKIAIRCQSMAATLFLSHEKFSVGGILSTKTQNWRSVCVCVSGMPSQKWPDWEIFLKLCFREPRMRDDFQQVISKSKLKGVLKGQRDFMKVSFSKRAIIIWLLLCEWFCNWSCINFLPLILHQCSQLTLLMWTECVIFIQ